MENKRLSPKYLLIFSWVTLGVSGFSLISNVFSLALSFAVIGSLSLLLGHLWSKYRERVPYFFIACLMGLIVSFSMFGSYQVSSYMNASSQRKKICGVVENIDIAKGSFDLVGDHSREKFPYYKHQHILKTAQSFCIEYAFDQRWSSYPHVFSIQPNIK